MVIMYVADVVFACFREIVHEGKIGMSQMVEYEDRQLTSSHENSKITNIYKNANLWFLYTTVYLY